MALISSSSSPSSLEYRASAPGSLFLLGEHAVLHNKRAIVLAIDKRINVTLKPRFDNQIHIHSVLGNLESSINKLTIEKPFQFILAAIKLFEERLKFGFDLFITSEFSSEVGLGSSAAVTVATLAVLEQFVAKEKNVNHLRLFEMAKSIIREVQGVGSGADVAASVYGGVIVYQQYAPYILKKLLFLLPLVVIYSGYKTPTPEVIKKVEKDRSLYPKVFEALYEVMDQTVFEAILLIEQENWPALGRVMDIQQGVMNALGVSTPLLNQLVDALKVLPDIYGVKISGSGLGDCIIGLGGEGSLPTQLNVSKISLAGTLQGVSYE